MKKPFVCLLVFLTLPVVAACSGGNMVTDTVTRTLTLGGAGNEKDAGSTGVQSPSPATSYASDSISDPSVADRMIVRNGNMTLLVEDIPVTLDQVSALADGIGGFVVSSQTWRDGDRYLGNISIRVPADQFDNAMRQLANMAVEVSNQSSSSQDVTAEYVDLSAKLKNLEATEAQLLNIMQQATKIEDVLAVQRELTDVRGQIEQIKGRMLYLERTSATSLIAVSLEQSSLGVEFTASRTSVKMNEEVQFNVTVFGGFAPFSYEWDFGDGNISTELKPIHKYAKAGTYSVSVKVTDDNGGSFTESRDDYVTVIQSGWSVGGVVAGTWEALVWVSRALLTLLIGLGIFSPLWGGALIIVWLVRRRWKPQAD